MEAEAAEDEYRRRMNAWQPVVATTAPVVADAYQGWAYQGGYSSDGYDHLFNSESRCDMCHDGTFPYCCDDYHGV
jgi:hypothetical protein